MATAGIEETIMAIHARALLTALTLLGGLAVAGDTSALAQGPNNPSTGGSGIGPSPIRPEFTRPGGLPGSARAIGAPERFCDPAVDKKKCKATTSN
ncbi:MAG: hypothetical protein HY659_08060 [Rhizobiales bacterium]|nr:hypothetical protein [Hyphomicrobiales bacterium]